MDPISAIIGAGSNLIGGLFGSKANKDAQRLALQDKEQDRALQREFAQSGIQWRVEDAKKAGIHPLAALGGAGASYSPSAVSVFPDNAIGSSIASAGQDISRALDTTRTSTQRSAAVTKTMQDLQLKRMGLENELLSAQIAKTRQAGNPPAMPSTQPLLLDGQGNSPVQGTLIVKDQPMKRNMSAPGEPHREGGAVADIGFARTKYGLAPVYSEDVKQRLEDDHLGMLGWNVRNRMFPMFGVNQNPPPIPLPKGLKWGYHMMFQEYRPYAEDRSGRRIWYRYISK